MLQLVKALHYKPEGGGFDLSAPVAERSKVRVCGRSLTGVAGSNSDGDMDVCVVLCCTVRTKGKTRTIWTKQYT